MKTVITLTITFLLIYMPLSAQEETTKKSIFSLGINTAQGISFTKGHTLGTNGPEWAAEIFNDIYKARYSYVVGGFTKIQFKPKWALTIGLNYNPLAFGHKEDDLIFGSQFNGTGFNNPSGEPYSKIHFKQTFHYLHVPVLLNITITKPDKKFNFFVTTGIEPGVLLKAIKRVSTYSNNQTDPKIDKYDLFDDSSPSVPKLRRFSLSVVVGAGVNYNINEKISLFTNPVFKTQIFDQFGENTSVNWLMMFSGIDVGVLFKL